MEKEFREHPSKKLQDLFMQRPFQMQEPEKSRIIFLGLDANFNEDIENNHSLFEEFLDYMSDGVGYWKRENIHSPMLKSYYNGMGKKYHENFRKLGFTSDNAQDICFLEIINVCTCGNSTQNENKFNSLLKSNSNMAHLKRIANLANDNSKQIFICGKQTEKYIKELNLFDISAPNIFLGKHFSDAISNDYLEDVSKSLKTFLSTGKHVPKELETHKTSVSSKQISPQKTSPQKSGKDFTKYLFNGERYGKGRLVLAVVMDYIKNNPSATISELKKKFPDETQYDTFMTQRFGVVQTESYVKSMKWEKRFYIKPEEKIHLADETVLVSKEWGAGNIDKFLAVAEKNGIKIEPNA